MRPSKYDVGGRAVGPDSFEAAAIDRRVDGCAAGLNIFGTAVDNRVGGPAAALTVG